MRDRETSPADAPTTGPDGAEAPAPDPGVCPTCGSPLQRGQDWCLDCGTAAPGRLGGRPQGWRAAFVLITATLLLVGGAVVASYAALSGDSERDADRPAAGSGAPIVADVPPASATPPTAPAQPTGPGTAQQTTPVTPPNAGRPQSGVGRAAPATPPTPAQPSPSPSPSPAPSTPSPQPAAPKPVDIKLAADAARTYDPYARPGAEFGAAKKATDGSAETVWDVTYPADNQSARVGLVVDLGGVYDLDSLKVSTPTPGFAVEVYGTQNASTPTDILDKRWTNLVAKKGVADGQSIALKGKSDKRFRRIVLWFTAPADQTDPRIAIGDVSVRGTA